MLCAVADSLSELEKSVAACSRTINSLQPLLGDSKHREPGMVQPEPTALPLQPCGHHYSQLVAPAIPPNCEYKHLFAEASAAKASAPGSYTAPQQLAEASAPDEASLFSEILARTPQQLLPCATQHNRDVQTGITMQQPVDAINFTAYTHTTASVQPQFTQSQRDKPDEEVAQARTLLDDGVAEPENMLPLTLRSNLTASSHILPQLPYDVHKSLRKSLLRPDCPVFAWFRICCFTSILFSSYAHCCEVTLQFYCCMFLRTLQHMFCTSLF